MPFAQTSELDWLEKELRFKSPTVVTRADLGCAPASQAAMHNRSEISPCTPSILYDFAFNPSG